MIYFDKEKYEDLTYENPNIIKEQKIYLLPTVIESHAVVDIFLTNNKYVIIESRYEPIRFGRHCGSRIIFSTNYQTKDYNPKLIWNGKEWLVQTFGTFLFAESELNIKE